MGRHRATDEGLPDWLYRTNGHLFQYVRPDTKRKVGFGSDKEAAVNAAEVLNEAFGPKPIARLHSVTRCRSHAYRYNWRDVPRVIQDFIAARMPDLAQVIAETRCRGIPNDHAVGAWARSGLHLTDYSGSDFVRVGELGKGVAPGWTGRLYRSTKKNALARGIAFDLTQEQLVALLRESKGRCAVTGIKLRHDIVDAGRRVKRPWAPSIDRIDSREGYRLANCRVTCVAANLAMSQWGESVLIEMAKAIARKHA